MFSDYFKKPNVTSTCIFNRTLAADININYLHIIPAITCLVCEFRAVDRPSTLCRSKLDRNPSE